MSYSDLAALLRSRPDAKFAAGASEEEIAQAEEAIGSLVGEIFGIGAGTTTRNDLVENTLSERSFGRIPYLVPVENIGTGDLICVRQIPGTLSESPVIVSPLDSNEADYIEDHQGFAHWLIGIIRDL
jgi:hypothetical protein